MSRLTTASILAACSGLRTVFSLLRPIAVCLSLLLTTSAQSVGAAEPVSAVKSDETVILFPTPARLNTDETEWLTPVHGWIFEPETGDLARSLALRGLVGGLKLEPSSPEGKLLRERSRHFLTDNERGKSIVVRIGERSFTLPASDANGHFAATLRIARAELDGIADAGRVTARVVLNAKDRRDFSGLICLVPPRGVTVISDIDDTIKVTEVRDKQQVLENTFLKPFRAVDGMAATYRRWEKQGATFMYLSNGPWQLYPPLSSFVRDEAFPAGVISLRNFRVQDGEVVTFLLADPQQAKLVRLEPLLREFPSRHFVLVGDSGEKDPETYGEIARRFPTQIRRILIRNVTTEPDDSPRYATAFREVERTKWRVFDGAEELADILKL